MEASHEQNHLSKTLPTPTPEILEQHWSALLQTALNCPSVSDFSLVGGSGSPVRIRSTLLLSYSSLISELYEQDASTIYLDFADEETLTQVVQLLHGFTVVFKYMDRVQMIKDVFHSLAIPFNQDSFHVFPYETLTRESELDITVEYETVGDDATQISGEMCFSLEVHDNGKHENGETHGTENESVDRLKRGEPEEIEPTSMDSPAETHAEDSQESYDEPHDPETNKSAEPPATEKPELYESRVPKDDEPAPSMIITNMSVLSRAEYMSQGQSPTIYNDSEFRAMLSEGKIKFNPLEHQLITQRYSTGMPVLVREKPPVPNSGLSSLPILEKQAPNTKRPNNPRKRMRKYEKMELYVGSKVGKEKALSEMVPFVHFYVEDDLDASGAQSSTNGSNQTQQHITNAGAASTGPAHGSSITSIPPPQNNLDTPGPEDPELTSQRPKKRKRLTPKTAETTTESPPYQKTSTGRLIEATTTGISGQPPNPSHTRSEATKPRTKKRKRLTDATTVASTTTPKSRSHPSNEPELALAQPEIQFKQTEREVRKKTPKRPSTKEPTPPVSNTGDTPTYLETAAPRLTEPEISLALAGMQLAIDQTQERVHKVKRKRQAPTTEQAIKVATQHAEISAADMSGINSPHTGNGSRKPRSRATAPAETQTHGGVDHKAFN